MGENKSGFVHAAVTPMIRWHEREEARRAVPLESPGGHMAPPAMETTPWLITSLPVLTPTVWKFAQAFGVLFLRCHEKRTPCPESRAAPTCDGNPTAA